MLCCSAMAHSEAFDGCWAESIAQGMFTPREGEIGFSTSSVQLPQTTSETMTDDQAAKKRNVDVIEVLASDTRIH